MDKNTKKIVLTEEQLNEEVEKALKNANIPIEILTEKDIKELKKEIEITANGGCILDGFFANTEWLYGKKRMAYEEKKQRSRELEQSDKNKIINNIDDMEI